MIPGEVRVSTEPLEFGTDAEKITTVGEAVRLIKSSTGSGE